MATYIALVNQTDQGIRNVKDIPQRNAAFMSMAEKMGIAVQGVYYTVGEYDIVVVMEGTDEAIAAALLKVGSIGNIRTQTMRAFSLEEIRKVIDRMP